MGQSSLHWHIVRPSFYAQSFGAYERENIEQRDSIFLPAGNGKTAFVSTVDVGEAIVQLLTQNPFPKHRISTLTGKQNLSHYDVAEMLSKILGRTITYTNPDEDEYRRVLRKNGVPDMVANYTVPLYALVKDNKVAHQTPDLVDLIRRPPESVEAVLRRDFA